MSKDGLTLGIDPGSLLLVATGLVLLILLALLVVACIYLGRRSQESTERAAQSSALEAELAKLEGRMQTLAEISVTRQTEFSRSFNERLDRVGHHLGQNLNESAQATTDSLARLNERLAVIDTAQRNITELSSNVVSLQHILANKQSRGAYGQGRMETIIADGLPKAAYSFQATLSNGNRPDCIVHLPGAPDIVIDAKFPLEGFEALRESTNAVDKTGAVQQVRRDVGKHIDDIAERYLLAGETQDTALMFVPSEAIYADLHEHFPSLIQRAHRSRIVIVSPNMLMLAVQTMQAILKDVKMREQAGLIQREVADLLGDVQRMRERVLDLQRHFGLANKDIDKILTSSQKVTNRGRRIETLDFAEQSDQTVPETIQPNIPDYSQQPTLPAGE